MENHTKIRESDCSKYQYEIIDGKLESKSLPKDYKIGEEPSSHSSSLIDYMKTYMSDNSDDDEEIYKMDNDDLIESDNNNQTDSLTKEQIENFDGCFKYGCPVTKKICENFKQ